MIEKQLWHPVIASHQVRDAPVACALLGQSLVLWREPQREHGHHIDRVHAWADQCPHRGAQLSLGRVLIGVHGARLECPYHGWQFGHTGHCQLIPAAPDFTPPAGHVATVFEARERFGLVWVRLQAPGDTLGVLDEPPMFAVGEDDAWRRVVCGPYELDTSAPRLVENFLDLSHFGFVHEGWLGERSHAKVDAGQVEEGANGLAVLNARAWQPRAYAGADEGAWIHYRYEVPHPFAAILRKDASEGDPVSNAIALFIRPDGDTSCTAWFVMATQGDASSDQELVEFQNTVFAQDRPVVESQTPRTLPIGRTAPVTEVHGPADRVSSAYRRYLKRLAISLGTC
ncbi:phenylpropionate dioxygenase-like ring-hydroxylating dioxygenase large terminal subunit [Hydrogenophaga palleronii]|uniref:Phenylpropionate dioxygenase-like ring-hydroxylating dioxygenase large terminal subunit n=1 Tax=Hydrogenophaga palleronii TaxID=65655 RepID=A0ABU1WR92_9BURK|nr:aromatic ring-hydroxylating dioxygenase subunit alpha [Hydrogenophaga palleronii]MDR7151427.1 phenylpropionate dioxygenase-like ring-hydroxylating dioxygenase large terminal subunit [Hydrogenophaga palleronii]